MPVIVLSDKALLMGWQAPLHLLVANYAVFCLLILTYIGVALCSRRSKSKKVAQQQALFQSSREDTASQRPSTMGKKQKRPISGFSWLYGGTQKGSERSGTEDDLRSQEHGQGFNRLLISNQYSQGGQEPTEPTISEQLQAHHVIGRTAPQKNTHLLLDQGAQANTIVGGTSTEQSVLPTHENYRAGKRENEGRLSVTERGTFTDSRIGAGSEITLGGSEQVALQKVREHQSKAQRFSIGKKSSMEFGGLDENKSSFDGSQGGGSSQGLLGNPSQLKRQMRAGSNNNPYSAEKAPLSSRDLLGVQLIKNSQHRSVSSNLAYGGDQSEINENQLSLSRGLLAEQQSNVSVNADH